MRTGKQERARIESTWAHLLKRPLDSITRAEISAWRADQVKAGRPHSGINRDINPLRAILRAAVEAGVIEHNPLVNFSNLKVDSNSQARFLNSDEDNLLRKALTERDETLHEKRQSGNQWRRERGVEELPPMGWYADHLVPLVLLALNTGMRRGELFNLRWRDVDLKGARLVVEGRTSKSDTTRHLPLNTEALEVLKKWKRGKTSSPSHHVFPGRDGGRLDNVNSAWRSVIKLANIPDFRFHDLRHTFASNLVIAGVPLNTVRELLGHSTMEMTLRYAHLSPDHKADAVALLNSEAAK